MNVVFEIEYTDRHSGERVTVEVQGTGAARELARELAMASGHRAVIRRKPKRQWRVLVADLETGEITTIEQRLTVREAAKMFRSWNGRARSEHAVCLYWPDWAPELQIQVGSRSLAG